MTSDVAGAPASMAPGSVLAQPVGGSAVTAVAAIKIYGRGDTEVRALDGLDVAMAECRFTAIMGPSGSGKSTLLHCLAGLDTLTSGRIWHGTTEISTLNEKALTRLRLFGDYVITNSLWRSGTAQVFDFVVVVKAAPGVSLDGLRGQLTSAVSSYPGLTVQNNAEYKKSQGDQIDQILNIMTVLLVFAIVIALLGVINTMALSIVERTREPGLVRALGMTRSQTRSMVRWETVLITVLGAVLGLAVGMFFGWALVKAFSSSGVDTLDLGISRQITYLVVAFLAGLVAAVFPALRASRVNMLRAIASE